MKTYNPSFLSYMDNIPKILEKERKMPYSRSELGETQKILRDFKVEKEKYMNVPDDVRTVGQLHRWKNDLIDERLAMEERENGKI